MNESRGQTASDARTAWADGGHGVAVGRANRPTHFVAAALPDRSSYERAVDAIAAVGVARDRVAVLQGSVGAKAIAEGRRRSRSWFDLSDEERYVERFEDAVRRGAWVIGVDLPDGASETRRRVRSAIVANGGSGIVSRGRWTHEVDP